MGYSSDAEPTTALRGNRTRLYGSVTLAVAKVTYFFLGVCFGVLAGILL